MSEAVRTRLGVVLPRIGFKLEPLWPHFIKYFVKRELKRYRLNGPLSSYRVRIQRKNRYHYIVKLDLVFVGRRGDENAG